MPRDPDYAGPPAPPAPAPTPQSVNPRTTYAAVNEGIDKTSLPGGFYLGATGGVRQYLPKEAYNAFVVQQAQHGTCPHMLTAEKADSRVQIVG